MHVLVHVHVLERAACARVLHVHVAGKHARGPHTAPPPGQAALSSRRASSRRLVRIARARQSLQTRVNTALHQHVCSFTHNPGTPRHLKLQISAGGGHQARRAARTHGSAAPVQQARAAGGEPAGRNREAHPCPSIEGRRARHLIRHPSSREAEEKKDQAIFSSVEANCSGNSSATFCP